MIDFLPTVRRYRKTLTHKHQRATGKVSVGLAMKIVGTVSVAEGKGHGGVGWGGGGRRIETKVSIA